MTWVIKTFNRLAVAWAGPAWAVAWQSTLMVGVFALVALGLRRSSPGLRYWLWQIAAIKLLVMPLWSVSIALPAILGRDAGQSLEAWPPAQFGGQIGTWPADEHWPFDKNMTASARPSEAQAGWLGIVSVDWRTWLLMGWGLAVAGQVAMIVHQRNLLERLLHQATTGDDPVLLALAVFSPQRTAGRTGGCRSA
jgi:hypothetical protein